MALCPFADRKLLAENATQAAITPRAIIAHSAGGMGELSGWWNNPASRGLESHFWISYGGRIVQYIDTEVRADANGAANSFAISIETESTTHATEAWPPRQADALVRLMDWLCTTHAIPREVMATPTSSGLGWHVMFGAPGPWTSVKGKVCPGPARIEQYQTEIIPAVAAATGPTPSPGGFLPMLTDAEQRELLTMTRENNLRLSELQAEVVGTKDAKGRSRMDRIAEIVGKLAGKG